MNEEETKAIIIYCDIIFGNRNISVVECLARLDKDARDLGLTSMQYINYIIANNRLPK